MNTVDNPSKIREARLLLTKSMALLNSLDLYAMNRLSVEVKHDVAEVGEAFETVLELLENEIKTQDKYKPAGLVCLKTYKDKRGIL